MRTRSRVAPARFGSRVPCGPTAPADRFSRFGVTATHGLIAILFALYSDKSARDILATDPSALFERLGLREHLTPQRSNGLKSMVARIRAEAATALTRLTKIGQRRA